MLRDTFLSFFCLSIGLDAETELGFFTQRPANMNIQCGDSSQLEILFFLRDNKNENWLRLLASRCTFYRKV